MANLEAIYDPNSRTYRIIDTDAGVEVVALDNKNVADNFVNAGVVTRESIFLAVRQDIATNGGPVRNNSTSLIQPFGAGPPDTRLLINQVPPPPPLVTAPPEQPVPPLTPLVREELPPPLIVEPVVVSNPPDAQVPRADAPTIPSTQVNTANSTTVQDDATSTGQGNVLATLDAVAVPAGDTRLDSNPAPVVSQTVFFPDGRILEVAGGEFVDDQGFVGSDTGIRRLAEDVAIDNTEELPEDGIVEFTAGGQRIVDAENPDFVITPGGLRVAAEDIDAEDQAVEGELRAPTDADVEEAALAQAALDRARQQASVSALRKANGKAVGDGDWRVRLRLAPNAYYLYKGETPGIMQPLQETDGVIFPYTPRIDMVYTAEYNPTDLIHSNYRGYFYKGSKVGEVVLTADFTAQDTQEADYLLATIHFFRSCTKMFYGQDDDRGAPPPLVFLSGLGDFQFNEHPCVISQFNYNLPSDVDYIRARGRQSTSAGVTQGGNGLMFRRTLTGSATSSYSLSSIIPRLLGANLPAGGVNMPPAPPNLGLNSPTYVPTKMSVSLTLLPMPTRSQVSQQFSLEAYANGNLLRGGFW